MRLRTALPLALVVAGCAGGAETKAPPLEGASRAPGGRVLAVVASPGGSALTALDARTLRPRSPRLPLDLPVDAWATSPDGRTLALAVARVSNRGDGPVRIRLVELDRMRILDDELTLPGNRHAEALVWTRACLLALVESARVAVIEPNPLRVVRIVDLPGTVVRWQAANGRIVALLAPRRGTGPARLAVVDGSGTLRTVAPGVEAGWSLAGELRQVVPALAVDSLGRRAVVVPPGDRVVEVDLRTLAVRSHELARRVSLLGRLRDWLEPPAQAKGVAGSERRAVWVGRLLAVTGSDGSRRRSGAPLTLVDTRSWTVVRRLDPVGTLAAGRDVVLAYGGGWAVDRRSQQVGLAAYAPGGGRLFHLFGRRRLAEFVATGMRAYVSDATGTRFDVVDLGTGTVIARVRTRHATAVLGALP